MSNTNCHRAQLERLEHDRLVSRQPSGQQARCHLSLRIDHKQTDDLLLTPEQFEKIKRVLLGEDDMMFEFEDITTDENFPTFRVWQSVSWGKDFLGVIRNTTNTRAKKRFPNSPLLWVAALAVEADTETWDPKATHSAYTKQEAATWLLGCRDAITNPKADAARAMLEEDRRRSAADNVCPVCDGKVSSKFIDSNTTKCESCEAELYRTEADRTPFHKPLWKPVGE